MKFKLDHIAIAVKDIGDAVDAWEKKLGLECEKQERVEGEKTDVAFFDVGGAHIELVSPFEPDAPLAKSIEKRGEGLHHICLEVEDIHTTMKACEAAGMKLVNPEPVIGAGGKQVAFLHPKGLNGVLVELVQKPA